MKKVGASKVPAHYFDNADLKEILVKECSKTLIASKKIYGIARDGAKRYKVIFDVREATRISDEDFIPGEDLVELLNKIKHKTTSYPKYISTFDVVSKDEYASVDGESMRVSYSIHIHEKKQASLIDLPSNISAPKLDRMIKEVGYVDIDNYFTREKLFKLFPKASRGTTQLLTKNLLYQCIGYNGKITAGERALKNFKAKQSKENQSRLVYGIVWKKFLGDYSVRELFSDLTPTLYNPLDFYHGGPVTWAKNHVLLWRCFLEYDRVKNPQTSNIQKIISAGRTFIDKADPTKSRNRKEKLALYAFIAFINLLERKTSNGK